MPCSRPAGDGPAGTDRRALRGARSGPRPEAWEAVVPALTARAGAPATPRLGPAIRLAGALALVWGVALGLLPAPLWAQTAPSAPRAAVLGEAVALELLASEAATFAFAVTETGKYRLTPGLRPPATQVTATLQASNRAALWEGAWTPVELMLRPDTYTLTFTAADDAAFDFVLVRARGGFAAAPEALRAVAPGRYFEPRALGSASLFARLQVPPQTEAREWFLQLEPEPAAAPLALTLTGDGQDIRQAVQGRQASVGFWSSGGEYLLRLDGLAPDRAPALTYFGRAVEATTPLYLNTRTEAALARGQPRMRFRLDVSDAFVAHWTLTSAYPGDLDLTVRSLAQPDGFAARSRSPFAREALSLLLVPDAYLVTVERAAGTGEAPFALALNVDPVRTHAAAAGQPAVAYLGEDEPLNLHRFAVERPGQIVRLSLQQRDFAAESAFVFGRQARAWEPVPDSEIAFIAPAAGPYFVGVKTLYGFGFYALDIDVAGAPPALPRAGVHADAIEAGQRRSYSLRIPEASHLISIVLVSLSEQDLDLETNQYDAARHALAFKTSSGDPQVESVAWYDPEPGYLLVSVLNFGREPSPFLLVTHSQPLDLE